MDFLSSLWMPIVVSAVIVHFASFLAWMVLPHHRSDFRRLPDEDATLDALKKQGVTSGQYSFPHCANPKEMKTPEFQRKMKELPSGMLTIFPRGGANMGKSIALHLVHCLVIGVFVAYITNHTVAAGSDYLAVFRVAGTVAFLAWAGGLPVQANWFGRPWSSVIKDVIDGLAYALLTAGVFGWLWPR
jgi:hypothetical protein